MFLFEKRHPIETDIITDILKSERIPYKLKAIRQENYFSPSKILGYDIEIYSDLEHFDFAKKLIIERIEGINKAESIFDMPSVQHPKEKTIEEFKNIEVVGKEGAAFCISGELSVSEYKPKKSLLKRIIEWINDHV